MNILSLIPSRTDNKSVPAKKRLDKLTGDIFHEKPEKDFGGDERDGALLRASLTDYYI